MRLDPQVEKFYHDKIVNRAFFVPGTGLDALRRGADAAFNDKSFVTDIAFWEDRIISFGQTETGSPRFMLKAGCEAYQSFAEPILKAEVPDLKVRVFRPTCEDKVLPVVLYFHGGGFLLHNVASHDALTRFLAKEWNAVVISAEYRLAPENMYPAYIQDAWALLHWTREHAGELKIDPERIIISGDSAGASICAAISRLSAVLESPCEPRSAIFAQILFYGAYGALSDDDSASMREFGGGDYVLPRAMIDCFAKLTTPEGLNPDDPFFYPGKGKLPKGMPRSIVVSAECDPLRDDGEAYAAALEAAGADVTSIRAGGMMHGFLLYWHRFEKVAELIKKIGNLL